MFRLTTLGALSIASADATRISLATRRRALALLALAAGMGNEGVSRDRAMALLWPELDLASARNNLKQTMFAIRRTLGADVFQRGAASIRIDRSVVACDVMEFERDLAVGALASAVERYAGPFLDGFHLGQCPEFDRWTERIRARLEWRQAHALERLVAAARATGDAPSAVRWSRRLVEHDPICVSFAVSLISTLAEAGEPHAALEHVRLYTARIRAEFDAEPDRRIRLAADTVRQSIAYRVAPTPVRPRSGHTANGSPLRAIVDGPAAPPQSLRPSRADPSRAEPSPGRRSRPDAGSHDDSARQVHEPARDHVPVDARD